MYPVSDWSSLCSGPSWISARARSHYRTGVNEPFGSPVFARAGKTDPPSLRILSQTSAGEGVWGHHVIACPFNAFSDQADWAAASLNLLASKERPCARTLQAIRASLLASAIARTLRCSRFLAASIQDLSPWRSQLFGLISTTHAACTNNTRR